ncbi:MAG: hypothetical protein AB7O59_21445 [Pirellulales bacterium]
MTPSKTPQIVKFPGAKSTVDRHRTSTADQARNAEELADIETAVSRAALLIRPGLKRAA